jgi:hypothetical protein
MATHTQHRAGAGSATLPVQSPLLADIMGHASLPPGAEEQRSAGPSVTARIGRIITTPLALVEKTPFGSLASQLRTNLTRITEGALGAAASVTIDLRQDKAVRDALAVMRTTTRDPRVISDGMVVVARHLAKRLGIPEVAENALKFIEDQFRTGRFSDEECKHIMLDHAAYQAATGLVHPSKLREDAHPQFKELLASLRKQVGSANVNSLGLFVASCEFAWSSRSSAEIEKGYSTAHHAQTVRDLHLELEAIFGPRR